jgi:hypothetical protein
MSEKAITVTLGIAASLVVLLSSGCEKSSTRAEWWQGEQQRLELTHQLALKEYKVQQSGYFEMEMLTTLRTSNQKTKVRLQTLVAQRSDLTVRSPMSAGSTTT